MRKLFLTLASLACGAALAQTLPPPEPSPPLVPSVRPPLGAASRASRHEWLALERQQRLEEKAEDRAEAEQKRKERRRALRRSEP